MTDFASRLITLRKNRGYSLDALTAELNKKAPSDMKFSRASLHRWEKGEISPSLDHAKVIANFFGVTLNQLGGIDDIQDTSELDTIAAHIDDDVTEEEMKEIVAFIKGIKAGHKNK
ncbi:XRE family transcriptional regulator [Macrococcus hajekii]|uniref:XRE family transcriptional regulator n=1 Tax=Macrococcus hajekii TaxID=198482 RepID=A0A4R6BIR2_9STAP|nr:helix-turn-helix transcriptional regulator [Macrococcus hajekii]TDM01436.1 XRE family transcriptional regulator [Macrococcus hajekii]GGA99979.1 transcriptional regulator [Macrococcus hajekii]